MILDDFHIPVMLTGVIDLLNIKPGKVYLDATIGGGGYTREILKRKGVVIGLDRDIKAIDFVKSNLREYLERKNLFLFNANFADLEKCVNETGFKQIAGAIFDLGLSSYQLDRSTRGFSYKNQSPLDMRFDEREVVRAEDIINSFSKDALYEIFTKNSEEINSRAISGAIVRARALNGRITTTSQLNKYILEVIKAQEREKNSILARIYQAIRMEVNNEIESLKKGLASAIDVLLPEGRMGVISYHSLEDRQVKNIFLRTEAEGKINIVTKKPLIPDYIEVKKNKRSRSAKLRVIEKI